MIAKLQNLTKTTKIFHRYFFHRYFLVSITHRKKSNDVIKLGYFINYLWTPITITYLKIIKIEALLFFQNSTNLLRLFSEFVHTHLFHIRNPSTKNITQISQQLRNHAHTYFRKAIRLTVYIQETQDEKLIGDFEN